MESYEILGRIGEGAHGVVFKAKHVQSGYHVALKKIALRKIEDGIPNNILREVKTLMALEEHPNIVRLFEVFPQGMGFVLVFEFMLSDLSEVLRNYRVLLSEPQIKCYMLMLLQGVAHCHRHSIIHRDLKPANLLLSSSGHLKIADFGLARVHCLVDERPQYSHQVATRWYRSPELLYGARVYDEGVDLWGVGCILGELINNSPLFPGENDIDQLCRVTRILGTPNEQVWPGLFDLPDYKKITFPDLPPIPLHKIVPDAATLALDLLESFLVYSSRRRLPAARALIHPYFFSDPVPAHHSQLPSPKPPPKKDLFQMFSSAEFDPSLLTHPSKIPFHTAAVTTPTQARREVQDDRERLGQAKQASVKEITGKKSINKNNKV